MASDLLNLFFRLDTGYIDLYLIHSPSPGGNVDSYKAMLKLQEEGVLRWSVICYYMKSERNISICNTFFFVCQTRTLAGSLMSQSHASSFIPSPFPFPGYQWACECLSPVPWGWGIWTMPGCSGKFEPVECICFKYRGVKRQRVCFCAQMAKKKFEWCLQAKDPILWCQKLICGFPRFYNICDHTKIHSMKNCAWIQHLNATLANGEGRGG